MSCFMLNPSHPLSVPHSNSQFRGNKFEFVKTPNCCICDIDEGILQQMHLISDCRSISSQRKFDILGNTLFWSFFES